MRLFGEGWLKLQLSFADAKLHKAVFDTINRAR